MSSRHEERPPMLAAGLAGGGPVGQIVTDMIDLTGDSEAEGENLPGAEARDVVAILEEEVERQKERVQKQKLLMMERQKEIEKRELERQKEIMKQREMKRQGEIERQINLQRWKEMEKQREEEKFRADVMQKYRALENQKKQAAECAAKQASAGTQAVNIAPAPFRTCDTITRPAGVRLLSQQLKKFAALHPEEFVRSYESYSQAHSFTLAPSDEVLDCPEVVYALDRWCGLQHAVAYGKVKETFYRVKRRPPPIQVSREAATFMRKFAEVFPVDFALLFPQSPFAKELQLSINPLISLSAKIFLQRFATMFKKEYMAIIDSPYFSTRFRSLFTENGPILFTKDVQNAGGPSSPVANVEVDVHRRPPVLPPVPSDDDFYVSIYEVLKAKRISTPDAQLNFSSLPDSTVKKRPTTDPLPLTFLNELVFPIDDPFVLYRDMWELQSIHHFFMTFRVVLGLGPKIRRPADIENAILKPSGEAFALFVKVLLQDSPSRAARLLFVGDRDTILTAIRRDLYFRPTAYEIQPVLFSAPSGNSPKQCVLREIDSLEDTSLAVRIALLYVLVCCAVEDSGSIRSYLRTSLGRQYGRMNPIGTDETGRLYYHIAGYLDASCCSALILGSSPDKPGLKVLANSVDRMNRIADLLRSRKVWYEIVTGNRIAKAAEVVSANLVRVAEIQRRRSEESEKKAQFAERSGKVAESSEARGTINVLVHGEPRVEDAGADSEVTPENSEQGPLPVKDGQQPGNLGVTAQNRPVSEASPPELDKGKAHENIPPIANSSEVGFRSAATQLTVDQPVDAACGKVSRENSSPLQGLKKSKKDASGAVDRIESKDSDIYPSELASSEDEVRYTRRRRSSIDGHAPARDTTESVSKAQSPCVSGPQQLATAESVVPVSGTISKVINVDAPAVVNLVTDEEDGVKQAGAGLEKPEGKGADTDGPKGKYRTPERSAGGKDENDRDNSKVGIGVMTEERKKQELIGRGRFEFDKEYYDALAKTVKATPLRSTIQEVDYITKLKSVKEEPVCTDGGSALPNKENGADDEEWQVHSDIDLTFSDSEDDGRWSRKPEKVEKVEDEVQKAARERTLAILEAVRKSREGKASGMAITIREVGASSSILKNKAGGTKAVPEDGKDLDWLADMRLGPNKQEGSGKGNLGDSSKLEDRQAKREARKKLQSNCEEEKNKRKERKKENRFDEDESYVAESDLSDVDSLDMGSLDADSLDEGSESNDSIEEFEPSQRFRVPKRLRYSTRQSQTTVSNQVGDSSSNFGK